MEVNSFPTRWEYEILCRANTACLGIAAGVNINQTTTVVVMQCRLKMSPDIMKWDWRDSTGVCTLNKYVSHNPSFVGDHGRGGKNGAAKYCTPAYTEKQVAQMIYENAAENPTLSGKEIATIVYAKGIYTRQPFMRHFRAVKDVLTTHMSRNRAVEMAALKGYAELFRVEIHYMKLIIYEARKMRKVRNNAAEIIFLQCKKDGLVRDDEKFDDSLVDFSDVQDGSRYYGGFVFVPSTSGHLCSIGWKCASADAALCQGVVSQSYETAL